MLNKWIPPGGAVIFDGDCGVCTWLMEWVARHDRAGRLTFHPSNHPKTLSDFPEFSQSRAQVEILVHDPRTGWYGGWQACEWIFLRIPLLWLLVPLTVLPGSKFIGDKCYKFAAARRQKISAFFGLTACKIPPKSRT